MTLWIGGLALGLAFVGMALGVFLTFRVLDFPDLTVDGSFPLGAAVSAVLIVAWRWDPWLTLPAAFVAGGVAGLATGLLTTRLRINGLLAGILVSLGLWTVNLRIMGDKSNLPLLGVNVMLTPFRDAFRAPGLMLGVSPGEPAAVAVFLGLAVLLCAAVTWFLHTELGLALRATGDNEKMVRALGTNTDGLKLLGLGLSNGLIAVSGAVVAQYQGFADVGLGLGMIVAGLASVIIGETLCRPRSVGMSVVAVALGVVAYRLVIALALFVGLGPTDMRLVTSVIVVLALLVPRLGGRRFGSTRAGQGVGALLMRPR